jgi:hypothetical protein
LARNKICEGTPFPKTELGVVRNIANLANLGWDDVIRAFKCYYKNAEDEPLGEVV